MVQARAKATRARILDQAAQAFARAGYDAASLTGDILEPAGVSVGSFYHQFDNKLDVLFALLRERLADWGHDFEVSFSEAGVSRLDDRLAMLVSRLLDHVDAEPQLCLIQLRERWNPDPEVRNAVADSWQPWRAGMARALSGAAADPATAATAAELLATAVLPTVGEYLDLDEARRASWRDAELPRVIAFCVGGVAALLEQPPVL